MVHGHEGLLAPNTGHGTGPRRPSRESSPTTSLNKQEGKATGLATLRKQHPKDLCGSICSGISKEETMCPSHVKGHFLEPHGWTSNKPCQPPDGTNSANVDTRGMTSGRDAPPAPVTGWFPGKPLSPVRVPVPSLSPPGQASLFSGAVTEAARLSYGAHISGPGSDSPAGFQRVLCCPGKTVKRKTSTCASLEGLARVSATVPFQCPQGTRTGVGQRRGPTR